MLGRHRCLVLQACYFQHVVKRYLIVNTELGEGLDPKLFKAEFDVAQVRIGYSGLGLYPSQGLGPPELSEKFPDRWALAGPGILFPDLGMV